MHEHTHITDRVVYIKYLECDITYEYNTEGKLQNFKTVIRPLTINWKENQKM
jgi:hypothetical protein